MRRVIIAFTLLLPAMAFAASGGVKLQHADNDVSDKASLQAGAKLFVNYCMGCHSAQYVRFSRIGKDLGLSDDELIENLMFSTEKVGETMTIAMDPDDAKRWFGVTPPDLSVIARARGVDWLYTYLLTFYLDPSRPWGVNNLVFKDVGMPHVLWEKQGWQKPVYETKTDDEGKSHEVIKSLELVDSADEAKSEQYKKDMRDLVNFLDYMGEPAKLERQSLGWKVMLFLFVFLIFAYLLKKEYWRDVH
ncbi:MAG: cytochrome c1 [Candidatus Parabeggiatoa sp. nov. 3]|nr:MAG: cytochrome c1 [Gammaproteobacteria bacterium]RKZ69284.1 MAG: cytochrome c1 [Gammaproteobacteria bacterium]RKZ86692.1 MAG: cytochrome c1 [Gammaproteobacteria bacterium]